jgi:hypothetical protein
MTILSPRPSALAIILDFMACQSFIGLLQRIDFEGVAGIGLRKGFQRSRKSLLYRLNPAL